MIGETINGVQIFIFEVGNKYMIVHGSEIYFADERPTTDQDVKALERELAYVNSMISELKNESE